MKRGEIYYADLSPVVGSEQGGLRPVLIIQNDVGNKHAPTTIVAPLTTSATKAKLPTHVALNRNCVNSLCLLEQIRTIDKSRIKSYMATLEPREMEAISKALKISLGI